MPEIRDKDTNTTDNLSNLNHIAAENSHHGLTTYVAATILAIIFAMAFGIITSLIKAGKELVNGAVKGIKIELKFIFLTGGIFTIFYATVHGFAGLIRGFIDGSIKGWDKAIKIVLKEDVNESNTVIINTENLQSKPLDDKRNKEW